MLGIYFIFFALATSICSFLIAKTVLHTKSSADPLVYGVFTSILGGIYATVFYLFTSFHASDFHAFTNPTFLWLLFLDVFIWSLGSRLYYPAFRHLPVSESTVGYALEGFFALAIAVIFLHTESLYPTRIIGGLLIFLAVFLINQKGGKWRFNTFFMWLLLSTMLFGLASVLDNKIIAGNYFSSPIFLEMFNFTLAGILLLFLSPKSIPGIRRILSHKKMLLAGAITSFTGFLSFLFIYNAYRRSVVASQANMVLSTQIVFIVLLGALFFRERKSLKLKLFAAAVACLGVYLLA